MSGEEQDLYTRAEMLADVEDLAAAVTGILAGVRHAGVDPEALGSLLAAAHALGASGLSVYAAGREATGPAYPDDITFLAHVSQAEDDVTERLRETSKLQEQTAIALDAAMDALEEARADLAAAYAMPTEDPCDGCHVAKAAAIEAAEAAVAGAEHRIKICEATAGILDPLAERLTTALRNLRQVPADLGEVYQLVYGFLRDGGKMPFAGRWIRGEGAPA